LLKRFDGNYTPPKVVRGIIPDFFQVKGSLEKTSHFGRRAIPIGWVAKARNMPAIPAIECNPAGRFNLQ